MLDVSEIITTNSLHIRFQPVVSIKHICVFGFEALCYAEYKGKYIPAVELFDSAREAHLISYLDHACIEKAVQSFSEFESRENLLLFINFESSQIDDEYTDTEFIFSQCRKARISPENVVIEIIESKVLNDQKLLSFVSFYKKHGFSIAIDDFGAGYSNLSRLALISPAIIKVDKSLAENIENDSMKEAIVTSLAKLSQNIGAIFLVEGVETESAAMKAVQAGAELLQGFYISRPEQNLQKIAEQAQNTIKKIMALTDHETVKIMQKELTIRQKHIDTMKKITLMLSAASSRLFEYILLNLYQPSDNCECAYIMDEQGIQITDTIMYRTDTTRKGNKLFRPAEKWSTHFQEPYFYMPFLSGSAYITDRYISGASGKNCITISLPFPCSGKDYYFCSDFSVLPGS
ncbi:MAG: EAL domain-containing protein [Treponema sp.]|nr:EAL domain-containing protein [Treponema sp.]